MRHLLLVVSAAALTAAGWLIDPSLGLVALSGSSGAAWWLLAPVGADK